MSGLGGLTYASRDAWAGCSDMFDAIPYIRRKGVRVTPLSGSSLETCLIALQTDAYLRAVPTSSNTTAFLGVWREVVPVGVAAREQLFASGRLLALAQSEVDVREVVAVIEQVVGGAS